ncbi:hypothetical protein JWV37_06275 [Sulfurospirillum sp. T05]|uniref:Uncharacterized protein n=1 Tax=Sulfurospirillum tamanense TaxID=2813362 RepID=A0ABS2WRT7_9BACT|nr:NUDIX-like domain-containing protein [Sulfurospirillum tamanensis]MBN2964379.1 hypothetical protein [Sulfurospirillum tamanensis]
MRKFLPTFHKIPNNATTIDLRNLAEQNLVEEEELGIFAQAQSVLNWHISHQHCACCGAKTHAVFVG